MNKSKMRICLLSIFVLVLMLGIFYYVYALQRNNVVMEGTLIQQTTESSRGIL